MSGIGGWKTGNARKCDVKERQDTDKKGFERKGKIKIRKAWKGKAR